MKWLILPVILILTLGSCSEDEMISGCMDPNSVNYNPEAELDDGSCSKIPIVLIGKYARWYCPNLLFTQDCDVSSIIWVDTLEIKRSSITLYGPYPTTSVDILYTKPDSSDIYSVEYFNRMYIDTTSFDPTLESMGKWIEGSQCQFSWLDEIFTYCDVSFFDGVLYIKGNPYRSHIYKYDNNGASPDTILFDKNVDAKWWKWVRIHE